MSPTVGGSLTKGAASQAVGQKIVGLQVKDVPVRDKTITIRHDIPIPSGPTQNGVSGDPIVSAGDRRHRLNSKYMKSRLTAQTIKSTNIFGSEI